MSSTRYRESVGGDPPRPPHGVTDTSRVVMLTRREWADLCKVLDFARTAADARDLQLTARKARWARDTLLTQLGKLDDE